MLIRSDAPTGISGPRAVSSARSSLSARGSRRDAAGASARLVVHVKYTASANAAAAMPAVPAARFEGGTNDADPGSVDDGVAGGATAGALLLCARVCKRARVLRAGNTDFARGHRVGPIR